MKPTGPDARVSAARTILEFGIKLKEYAELTKRIAALEMRADASSVKGAADKTDGVA